MFFTQTHLSISLILNSFGNITLSNFLYHYLGAYFKLYNNLTSLKAFFFYNKALKLIYVGLFVKVTI